MTGSNAQALQELYAGRLAHIYRRVAGETAARTAQAITKQATELAKELASLPVSPAMETLLRSAANPETAADAAADLRARSMLLQQLADEAYKGIEAEIARLEAALRRHDTMLRSIAQYAVGATYQDPALNASLSQFENDVRNRCGSIADRLAESRYDQAAYRHLLIHELLDIAGLAQVMSGVAEAGHKKQRERWRSIGAELGVLLTSDAPRSSFNMAALVDDFLAPMQLIYERPGMLKSIAQALNRGKFQEKLTTEAYSGLAQMRPHIEDAIVEAWTNAEQHWRAIAEKAVDAWLEVEVGSDKSACIGRLAYLQQKLAVIREWQADLQQLTPQQLLASWSDPLRQQASSHLQHRLAHEQKRTAG